MAGAISHKTAGNGQEASRVRPGVREGKRAVQVRIRKSTLRRRKVDAAASSASCNRYQSDCGSYKQRKALVYRHCFLTSRLSKKYDIKNQRPSLALLIQALTRRKSSTLELGCCFPQKYWRIAERHVFRSPSGKQFFVHKLRFPVDQSHGSLYSRKICVFGGCRKVGCSRWPIRLLGIG